MHVIGLTGGIGSGKTAASDLFKSLGITIVDADIVSREVVEPGKPALKAITERFGNNILLESGELDRSKLREIIFSNPNQKLWLESLLHPLIREEIKQQLAHSASPYTILVSPLLLETNQAQLCTRILLIDVPEDIQLQRASARDQNTEVQIRKIIDSQMPRSEKLAKVDDVICNDHDLNYLESEIRKYHHRYLELARVKHT